MNSSSSFVIGRISTPFGVRGGMKFQLLNPSGETLKPGLKIRVVPTEKKAQDFVIEGIEHFGVMYLVEITDRDQAKALAGSAIWVNRSDLPELDPDEVYLADLLGALVLDVSGQELGVVSAFAGEGERLLVEIKTPAGKSVLVPFVKPILKEILEKEAKVILDPPEGLFEP